MDPDDLDLASALDVGTRSLVAFVGAGGKKTAMARLVDQAQTRDRSVGYTTTVHTPPPADIPLVFAAPETLQGALAGGDSPVAFAAERVSNPDRAAEKVRGFEPDVVDAVFESGRFDWLLVKADGARRREFKAPGPDEPVVPTVATHVVPIASVRAVGRPLGAPAVHRPERVAAITDLEPGQTVTPAAIGRVLAHSEGGLKHTPADADVVPVLNKADTPAQRADAREAIRVALSSAERLQRGLVTSFETGYWEVVGA